MNILFLTLIDIVSIEERGIYQDLMREIISNGDELFIISPTERRHKQQTRLISLGKCSIVKVKIGNIQKTNVIEKGIATVLIDSQIKSAIRNYFADIRFDLVIYSTPPITYIKIINYIKKRDGAKTYLLLKDIFPQNAVDLGMLRKNSVLYQYFRKKETSLYKLSDRIGCMSQANVDFVLKHNPWINPSIVEIFPNCIDIQELHITEAEKLEFRTKYGIPLERTIFVYGGNLGKPQGIDFLIACLKAQNNNNKAFFLIVGSGTEYNKLKNYISQENPLNVVLMEKMPKNEYDKMISSCDIGMIFLDHRFTIPNFPSRLLSYMQARLPVLACTDRNTDLGKVIVDGGFGWWCESNDTERFSHLIDEITKSDLTNLRNNASSYLHANYDVRSLLHIILNSGVS
jgi:glycosyltransferase involved in cell wall biosynthesis